VTELPERPLDALGLLRTLAEHGVEYVVIGGVAVQVHGHRRTTRDLDLIPSPDPDNTVRLVAALAALEATPRGMPGAPVPTAEQLSTAPVVPPLTTRDGELHILNSVPGARSFAALATDALVIDLDGIPVRIVSLDDLIAMKRASGRPADLEDIAVLTSGEWSSPDLSTPLARRGTSPPGRAAG